MLFHKTSTQSSLLGDLSDTKKPHGLQPLKAQLAVPDSQSPWLEDHF